MRFLVVGAGRLGRTLAHELLQSGHAVRLLDDAGNRIARLPETLKACAVEGSALDRATLAAALDSCDGIATATGDDAFNATVALGARAEFDVPAAVAVVASPARAEALAELGVQVICPTVRTARELAMTLLRSDVESELHFGAGAGLYRAELPARLSGRTLAELHRDGELVPVALERAGRVLLAAAGIAVEPGDVLHAAAVSRALISDIAHP